jgi:hypothetical protein
MPDRLEEIRARLTASEPGPWETYGEVCRRGSQAADDVRYLLQRVTLAELAMYDLLHDGAVAVQEYDGLYDFARTVAELDELQLPVCQSNDSNCDGSTNIRAPAW